jgi:hypothetical protein
MSSSNNIEFILQLTCSIWLDDKWSEKSCEKLKLNTTSRIACKCKTPSNSVIIRYQKPSSENENAATIESNKNGEEKVTESTLKFGDLTSPASTKITEPSSATEDSTEKSDPNKMSTTEGSKSSSTTTDSPPLSGITDGNSAQSETTGDSQPDAASKSSSSTTTSFVTQTGNLPTAFEIPASTQPTTNEMKSTRGEFTEVTTVKSEQQLDTSKETSASDSKTTAMTTTTVKPVISEPIKMNKSSSTNEKGVTKGETGKAPDKLSPTTIKVNGTTASGNVTDGGVLSEFCNKKRFN